MFNLREKFKNYTWLRSWRPYFIFFVLGFFLYGQTLFFNYTYFDDHELVLNKLTVLQDFKNIPDIFSSDAFLSGNRFYYRPILNLSLMLDAHLSGELPIFYHLSNVFLHILATVLLFIFLIKINYRRDLSFFFSLFFLVHPIATQAVTWIPGRNDSLLTIFCLSAFIYFLKFLDNPRLRFYASYLLFFFIALLTKESAIFLPFLVIFYFLFVSQGKIFKTDKILLIIGSAAVAFVWFLMRSFALGGEATNYLTAFREIIENSPALILNFGKLLLPFNLAVFPILKDSSLVYGVVALAILIPLILFSERKKNNYLIFGLLWFLIFLLPSFIQSDKTPYFLEHRLYLSLVGFIIIILEIDWIKALDFSNKKIKIRGAIILIFLASLTFFHSLSFRNSLVFWQAAVKKSPHAAFAQKNLGAMYYLDGNLDAAYHYYSKSLEINSSEPMIHNNLGLIYQARGDEKKAEQEFKLELSLYPNYDKALFNLGNLYYQQGKTLEAKFLFDQSLRANPYNYKAY